MIEKCLSSNSQLPVFHFCSCSTDFGDEQPPFSGGRQHKQALNKTPLWSRQHFSYKGLCNCVAAPHSVSLLFFLHHIVWDVNVQRGWRNSHLCECFVTHILKKNKIKMIKEAWRQFSSIFPDLSPSLSWNVQTCYWKYILFQVKFHPFWHSAAVKIN